MDIVMTFPSTKKRQGISQIAVLYFERAMMMWGGQYGHGELNPVSCISAPNYGQGLHKNTILYTVIKQMGHHSHYSD